MLVLNYYFNYVKCKNDKKGTFLCLHDFQSNQNTFNGIINSISEEYDYYSLNLLNIDLFLYLYHIAFYIDS